MTAIMSRNVGLIQKQVKLQERLNVYPALKELKGHTTHSIAVNIHGYLPTPSLRILMCNIGDPFFNYSSIIEWL